MKTLVATGELYCSLQLRQLQGITRVSLKPRRPSPEEKKVRQTAAGEWMSVWGTMIGAHKGRRPIVTTERRVRQ